MGKAVSEFQGPLASVEIAAASCLQADSGILVVYSAADGGARTAIFRNGMLADILVSDTSTSPSDKPKAIAASGHPQDGDILILGTSEFFNITGQNELKEVLLKGSLSSSFESIASLIHSKKDSSRAGAVAVRFEKKRTETIDIEKKQIEEEKGVRKKEETTKSIPSTSLLGRLSLASKGLAQRLPSRRIYVRKSEESIQDAKARKTTLTVGIILVVLLIVSIGFGIAQKQQKDKRAVYESRLEQASHEFEESLGLVSINSSRARELFVSSRKLVDEMVTQGIEDPQLTELKKKVDESEGLILGEYVVVPELFVDLSLLSDGFNGGDMASSLERVFVLDPETKRVVGVFMDTKKSKVIAGPTRVGEAEKIAAYADRAFVTRGSGIYQVDEAADYSIEKDWSSESLIYAYAGNIYVLDKNDSKVYRYPGVDGGFANRQDWLAPGIDIGLNNVISWTIDGSVWLFFDNGKITKLTSGAPSKFDASGVFPELTSASVIYTNEELENVYMLDRQSGRIVVTDKEGEYKAQYLSDQFNQVKDFAISEKEKRAVLLVGDKLLFINLDHLN